MSVNIAVPLLLYVEDTPDEFKVDFVGFEGSNGLAGSLMRDAKTGVIIPEWARSSPGSVVVARRDRKPLHRCHVEMMSNFMSDLTEKIKNKTAEAWDSTRFWFEPWSKMYIENEVEAHELMAGRYGGESDVWRTLPSLYDREIVRFVNG
ncbi:hypothetical protein RQP46_006051 [Phenoliferia psychrophenolica]